MDDQSKINTIVFDIGNTLIQVDDKACGKMIDWPELKIIQGADLVLKTLSQKYQIIIASNAEDSDATDLSKALYRVGLDPFINQYFTIKELQAKKPDLTFYNNLLKALNIAPDQMIMIGDDYQKDILPAITCGMHTIWFNAQMKAATAHFPLQEKECYSLTEIPEVIQANSLPTLPTCLNWYLQQDATHTLMAHVYTVAAASYQLAIWLREVGINISPLLSQRGGLLHDISKLKENGDENHAALAFKFLEDRGQPELASIARRHLIGDLTSTDFRPITWEEKVVNYCDKLTEGSELVLLDQRLDALKQRYKNFAEKITKNTPTVRQLEQEILSPLLMTPIEALSELKKSLFLGSRNSS